MTTLNGKEINSCFEFTQEVVGFGYGSKIYKQHVTATVDKSGNVELRYRGGSLNFYELFEGHEEFKDYQYKNVSVGFYGKNTRIIDVGRSSFTVTAEDKIADLRQFFLPDLYLAQALCKLYDEIHPYGFDRGFQHMSGNIQDIIEKIKARFEAYKLSRLLRKNEWQMPSWVLAKVKTIDEYSYFERIWKKFLSYDEYTKRRKKYILVEPRGFDKATRTIFLNGQKTGYLKPEHSLFDIKESYIRKINSYDTISVWTSGLWLYAHTKEGENIPITTSWVEETMDMIESSLE